MAGGGLQQVLLELALVVRQRTQQRAARAVQAVPRRPDALKPAHCRTLEPWRARPMSERVCRNECTQPTALGPGSNAHAPSEHAQQSWLRATGVACREGGARWQCIRPSLPQIATHQLSRPHSQGGTRAAPRAASAAHPPAGAHGCTGTHLAPCPRRPGRGQAAMCKGKQDEGAWGRSSSGASWATKLGPQAGHLTRPGNQATSPAMPPGSSLSTCCTCPLSEHATWALMTSVGEGAVPAGATGAQPLSPMAGRTRRAGVRRPAGRPRT